MDKGKGTVKTTKKAGLRIRILIVNRFNQDSESGSVFGIRIRYGSGRAKMTLKSRKN
jgi:hypothetical protein